MALASPTNWNASRRNYTITCPGFFINCPPVMNPFIQIAQGAVGAILISLFFILRSSFGETRHNAQYHRRYHPFHCEWLHLTDTADPMGKPAGLAQISSETRIVRVVSCAHPLSGSTPRLAFVDGVYTGTAQFWDRGCRQSYYPSRTTHPPPLSSCSCTNFCCFPSFCTAEKS